ncbi:class I SAM-dependent methyltransferase [Nonomuraea sediminis]|uniref:class I SAM-dependent methyltransferase n=1 Tax=Nonomuraea sediminis TaxID=2835864 RepID=UPI001BDD8D32|nr:methyltransferase domain-containing protein [Nonomuraea sediminis]
MGFAPGESGWRSLLGNLRNVVRQELVTRQLARHLPEESVRVLDAGCGQGTQALRLAARGHRVTALDSSADLLGLLRREIEPGMDVRVVHADLDRMGELFEPGSFDVVLCHGVLMYFDDPDPLIAALARVLAPGGMLSLLVRNGDALAMRPGLLGDWAAAGQAFGAGGYTNRIGVRARADRLEELVGRLAVHDLRVEEWYGVRVFTDAAANDAPVPGDLEALLECEEQAGRTDPYRRVAALTHLVVR